MHMRILSGASWGISGLWLVSMYLQPWPWWEFGMYIMPVLTAQVYRGLWLQAYRINERYHQTCTTWERNYSQQRRVIDQLWHANQKLARLLHSHVWRP